MPKENLEENLEGRLLRDRIAEISWVVGSAIGGIYALITQDNEGASFVQRVLHGLGMGAIYGVGAGYTIGTIAKLIYEKVVEKYEIIKRE